MIAVGVAELVAAVTEGFADGKKPFKGNRHDQVCLPGHHYVLQRVPKVRKQDDIDCRSWICKMIYKKNAKEENVTKGKW